MTHFLSLIYLRPIDGINLLILLVLLWILYRIVRNEDNDIAWEDFISTRAADGRQHGDINKVGQWFGIVIATMPVLMYVDNDKVEPTGLAALLAVSLLYLGGVAGYAANLRAKQGSVTTTTEPVPDPAPSKVTTVQVPPIALPTHPYAEGR